MTTTTTSNSEKRRSERRKFGDPFQMSSNASRPTEELLTHMLQMTSQTQRLN